MNLKEAFRCQNILDSYINLACSNLCNDKYVMRTISTHHISEASPGAEDKIEDSLTKRDVQWEANDMLAFLDKLFSLKEELTVKIGKAKRELPVDMDAELSLNHTRRKIVSQLNNLVNRKSYENTTRGSGYRLNNEGNQVAFYYNIDNVTTIDFDRNSAKAMKSRLTKESDSISDTIDRQMLETEVDFAMPFDVGDSFDEVLEQFISTPKEA